MTAATERTIILLPVYNDWDSLQQLLPLLHQQWRGGSTEALHFVVVNDGSTLAPPPSLTLDKSITLLHLTHNLGHQKALAVGLSYIHHHWKGARVLVMDADGDDRPEDAALLLKAATETPQKIIVAWRGERREGLLKITLYRFYLLLFRWMTGAKIRFGNFCVLPAAAVKRLVYRGDIWLHLPGGIVKSKWPLQAVRTAKGQRYADASKMNVNGLMYHGMGALAAFIDVIAMRLLTASALAILASLICLAAIFLIKTTTSLAIPGWASLLGSIVIVILLLSFLMALFLIFTFLISQSYRKFVPALHYNEMIESVENAPL